MKGIRPKAVRRGLVWAAAMFVWSCGSSTDVGSGGSDGVASIQVTPPTTSVAVGAEVPLQATPQDATGKAISGVSVVWTVQDSRIAKVSSAGVVTGLAVGTTQVAANANGKSGIAAITVMRTPVASVVVLPERIDGVTPGTKTPLTATVYDAAQNALTDRTIAWTTSNEAVAAVDANGVVTAMAPGSATITGTVEGKSDATAVTVAQAPVSTVEVFPSVLTLSVNQSTQMIATAKDVNGTVLTGRPVAWSSSNQSVATIDAQGKLTAVSAGTTTVTATSEGKSGTAAITISTATVGSVTVQPPAPTIVAGTSVQLTAIVKDPFETVLTNRAVAWSSSNTAVATVNQAGLVTGVGPGSATITATSEGKSGTATVTVTQAPVATVTIQPPSASVTAGKTSQLTATLKDANGNTLTGRSIAWSSSNTNVATVSSTGLVTALAVGTTVITAASEGKSGTANINVLAPLLAVGSVAVTPTTASVIATQTTTLAVTVKDIAGTTVTDRTVAWSSSSDAIATVSSAGVVTGVTPGTATITATAEGKSGTSTVTVLPVPVGSVSVAPTAPNIIIGTTGQLTATVKDLNGTTVTDRPVTWTSSANGTARVSTTGLVTAVALGTATITATAEGKSGTSTVTVVPVPVASVTVSPSTNPLFIGQNVQLTTTVKDQNGTTVTNRVVTWTSSDDAVATVNATGRVTAVGPGAATITATSEGKSGTASVTVAVDPVATVTVSPPAQSVPAGQTVTLTATLKSQNGTTLTGRTVTWSSSDQAIATVSSSGVVTAIAVGQATITATSEGKTGTATVTVTPVPVGSVTVTPGTASVAVTQTTPLTATVKDQSGVVLTDRVVQWSTNNPAVATVSQTGVVTGVIPGTATITAATGGKSGTSTITVTLLPVATVTVTPSPAIVDVGRTIQLTATTKDLLGGTLDGRTVGWQSSNTNVATVSQTGVVTGVAVGTAVITATSEGKSGTSNVTVQLPPVNTVTVAPLTATVFVAFTQQLTATLKDGNGNVLTGRTVTWQSSNNNAATVSATGLVTGVAPGTASITAVSEGKTGSSTITVTVAPVNTVTVTPNPSSVATSLTTGLTATLKDANGNTLTGRPVTWQSSNNSIATVNSSGIVTGVSAGSATITATSEGKSGTSALTVTQPPVSTVSVTPATVSLGVGETRQLIVTLKDSDGNVLTGRTVSWSSEDPAIVTVSSNGLVTAKKRGTVDITATSEGKSDSATITVTK